MSNGTWVEIKSGVMVLRLWEIEGSEEHHVAILKLSAARYKEFDKDPIRFLSDNDIFYTTEEKKKLNQIVGKSTVTPNSKNLGGDWMVTAAHDWNVCNVQLESMPLFKPREKPY
jgi:hypothetical protein